MDYFGFLVARNGITLQENKLEYILGIQTLVPAWAKRVRSDISLSFPIEPSFRIYALESLRNLFGRGVIYVFGTALWERILALIG